MEDQIDTIAKYITENDKLLLEEVLKTHNHDICKKLSFYSHKVTLEKLDNYIYIKTHDNEPIFITNGCGVGNLTQICIDNEYKLIFDSRFWFHISFGFISHLKRYFENKSKFNLNNTIYLGENIIAIQKWFDTYGHFLDEQFNLCDFMHKFELKNDKKYKILHEYAICDNYKNYPNISNILFKDKFINPYNLANKEENINMLEVKNLYLIRNRITDITFHSFPTIPRNLIKDSIEIGDNDDKYKSIQNSQKCFITRSIENSGVLNRCLSNQLEIENILERNSFVIINPEKISFDDLINNLRFPTLIVITWGSALTNLNFLNPKTKVFILKSKSYANENISLFEKIIGSLDLDVTIITDVNNTIPEELLEEIINYQSV